MEGLRSLDLKTFFIARMCTGQASANVCFIICSPSCSAVQLQLVPYLQLTIIEKNIIEQTAINSKVFVPLYCIVAVHKKEKSFSVLLYFQLFGEKKENKEPPLSKRNNNKCAVLWYTVPFNFWCKITKIIRKRKQNDDVIEHSTFQWKWKAIGYFDDEMQTLIGSKNIDQIGVLIWWLHHCKCWILQV